MIFVDQTILHDPENGQHGNCLSAVLASLLHLDIKNIPIFTAPYPQWQVDLNTWLRQYDLAYIQLVDFKTYCNDVGIEGCYHEIAGTTERFNDVLHACVGINGELTFDPQIDRSGLKEIVSSGIFIALKPWKIIEGSKSG